MTPGFFQNAMSGHLYKDRADAAAALALLLAEYKDRHPLILAIPRGALPIGKILAEKLHGELDIVLVHKLRAPFSPEFAIGAIDETGWTYIAPSAREFGVGTDFIEEEKLRQMAALKSRRQQYTPHRSPIDPKGRIAIIVDDGLATGATMIAALHAARARQPAELVCAVPVAAADSLKRVAALADKTVCPSTPADFMSVAQYYRHFPQVEDDEAIRLLSGGA